MTWMWHYPSSPAGKERNSKAKEQSLSDTHSEASDTSSYGVSSAVQHCLEKQSSRKNEIAGIIFTSLEVTFSRSLLIMMLRSLALMSRSVRSLSVGLERQRRGCCLQAGSK